MRETWRLSSALEEMSREEPEEGQQLEETNQAAVG